MLLQPRYYPTDAHKVKNLELLKHKNYGGCYNMFRFKKKPSSGGHSQYLSKITSVVQCTYRRRTDVVSAMAA